MNKLTKIFILLLVLTGTVAAKELPSWGMTESQYKMPNFATKMQNIGNQALKNDWLLKITAPKDWHSKIRAALSDQGVKNVQINFKDSLYKSITIAAIPGMDLKSTTSENVQPGVVKKQVVIEKPEMDTEIEAPEFDNNFNTEDILSDIEEIELELPGNGSAKNKSEQSNKKSSIEMAESDLNNSNNDTELSVTSSSDFQNSDKQSLREDLRMRHARNKTVDKSISYANITEEDDLFVADDVVLVKRYVNRGVAVYYWMTEAYDPNQHHFTDKGSGKYVKTGKVVPLSNQRTKSVETHQNSQKTNGHFFDFVAVTDNQSDQNNLRQRFIRNKSVNDYIKASQLKSQDVLYVLNKTVLVERPIGNSRSAYFWLEGATDIQQSVESKGPQQFVIQ